MKINEIVDLPTFTCACCQQVFDRERPSEQAIQEEIDRRKDGYYEHLGPDQTPDEVECLCDDCFKEFCEYVEEKKGALSEL